MTMQVRMWLTALSFFAVIGLVSGSAVLLQDTAEQTAIKKLSEVVKKGNADDTKKAVAEAAKKFAEPSELMHMYRPRKKGGMGWGATEGKNPAADGLEKKIQEFAKGVPATAANDVANNVEAGQWMVALAEITKSMAPTKDAAGGKTKKAWIGWSEELRDASNTFIKAAEAKKGTDMAKAASKINSLCINCHSKFKE
jgi:hypothetical protein